MGAACYGEKRGTMYEYQEGNSYHYGVNKRVFMKRLNSSNIGPESFVSCSASPWSISKMGYIERPSTLIRVPDSHETSRRVKAKPLVIQSYFEEPNRYLWASSESNPDSNSDKGACGAKQQQGSWSGQHHDESQSRISGSKTSSRFVDFESSYSDHCNSPKIVYFQSENRKLHLKDFSQNFSQVDEIPSSIYKSSTLSESSTWITPHPITEIIPGKLYLGCEDQAYNEDELLAMGITHIISVTNRINRIQGIEHEHFVMSDMGRTEVETVLAKVYPFMERAQQAENKLFVYCKLGQNRSPTLVISFLMKSKGLTLYEAHKTLKVQRPLIQIHQNYAKMLLKLERELFGETSLPDDWMEVGGFDLLRVPYFKSEELTVEEQQSFKMSQNLKIKSRF